MGSSVRIPVVLALLCIGLCALGCRKGQQDSQQTDRSKNVTGLTLDGCAADWEGVEPILKEAGLPDRGDRGGFDVKQVYLKTDSRNLYLFARCEPTILKQFADKPVGGQLFEMYLDTDNQVDTGTANMKVSGFYEAPGYDRKIWVTAGVTLDRTTGPRNPTATVFVFQSQDGAFPAGSTWKTTSDDPNASVAPGPDGVEAIIPLDTLGLKPGATVRMLLVEHSHFSDRDGFNETKFTVAGK